MSLLITRNSDSPLELGGQQARPETFSLRPSHTAIGTAQLLCRVDSNEDEFPVPVLQFSIVMAAVCCAWIHFVRLHLPSSCTALGEITEKKKGEEGV